MEILTALRIHDGMAILELPSNQNFRINGDINHIAGVGDNNKLVFEADFPPTLERYTVTGFVKEYRVRATNEILSVSAYNALYGKAPDTGVFINQHQQVIQSDYTYFPVTVQVIGKPEVKNPYLIPEWKISGNISDTAYRYRIKDHFVELFVKILTEAGYSRLATRNSAPVDYSFYLDASDSQPFQYSKIYQKNHKYDFVSTVMPEIQISSFAYKMGSYEELQSAFEANSTKISQVLNTYLRANEPIEEVLNTKVGEIMQELRTLERYIGEIESKQKTVSSQGYAVTTVRRIIDKIQKSCVNTNAS